MDGTMGNEGVNRLAATIQGRVKQISDKPASVDFGTINPDMSLTTNGFPQPVPKSGYMVCRTLATGIKPGARVLVAWAGDDPCIIDVVISGAAF